MSTQGTTFSDARDQRRTVRSSAPLLLKPLVPVRPVAVFVSAAILIGLAILIVALKPVTATLVPSVLLLLFGLWLLAAGFWNEAHASEVTNAVNAGWRARHNSMRRHPVLWLTVLPLAAGARAVERMTVAGRHQGVAVVLIVGLGAWLVSLAVIGFRVYRARER